METEQQNEPLSKTTGETEEEKQSQAKEEGTQTGTPDISHQIEKQEILLDKELMERDEKLAIQKDKIPKG